MIWHPRPGERVVVAYRKGAPRHLKPWDGYSGRVIMAGAGPDPINVLVVLDASLPGGSQLRLIVPRGNLMAVKP